MTFANKALENPNRSANRYAMKWKTLTELTTELECARSRIDFHWKHRSAVRPNTYIVRRAVTDLDRKRDDLAPQHLWLYALSPKPREDQSDCEACGSALPEKRRVIFEDRHFCIPCHRKAFLELNEATRKKFGL